MQRFDQRTVLITGAGSGIGRAAARRFAEEGARLVLVDRNQEGLEETGRSLPEGTQATLRTVDVSDEQAVNALVQEVIADHGPVHALVNNAGIAGGDIAPDTAKLIIEAVQALSQIRAVEELETRIAQLEERQS